MGNFLRPVLLWLVLGAAHAAEGGFSRGLSPEEFRAAGLGKLTAEELARLDALVEVGRAGAGTKPASAERTVGQSAVRPEATALVKGRQAAAPAPKASGEATVVVAPGTKIEFSAVESRLTGTFTGWEPRGLFVLENGQRWREANGSTYVSPPLSAPKVRITPGALGTFWMEIEGVRVRVKVVRLDSGR